jgi:hypothetical protein
MHVARTASRSKRLARLRVTALPTPPPTARPTRGGEAGSPAATTHVTNADEPRLPELKMRAKSREEVNRSGCGIPEAVPPLDGEPRAPFPAPPGQHSATGAGSHARTESVHAFPASVVGLIRALHSCRVWQSKRRKRRASNTCDQRISTAKTCRSSLWKREFPFLYPQGALLILAPRWNAGDASVTPRSYSFLSAAYAVVFGMPRPERFVHSCGQSLWTQRLPSRCRGGWNDGRRS